MVGFVPDDGAGPIELLGQHESGQLMRKRGFGKGPSFVRPVQNSGAQAERSSNDETHLGGGMQGMILQIAGQVRRAHASARPRQRNDLGGLRESGQKQRLFHRDRAFRVSFRTPCPARCYFDHIELPIPSRPCFVFEYGILQERAGPPYNEDRDLHGFVSGWMSPSTARRMSAMTASSP